MKKISVSIVKNVCKHRYIFEFAGIVLVLFAIAFGYNKLAVKSHTDATTSTRIVAFKDSLGSEDDGNPGEGYLLIDTETGVQYLEIVTHQGVAVTPLYDADGNIKITKE